MISGGGQQGFGYSYADTATAHLIEELLADIVRGHNAVDVPPHGRRWSAPSAIWDGPVSPPWPLPQWILPCGISKPGFSIFPSLACSAGRRDAVPIYGSGGFTSYSRSRLRKQLADWVAEGIPHVKMKIGSRPDEDADASGTPATPLDPARNCLSMRTGPTTASKLTFAEIFADLGVSWFEEPVTADDLEGLRLLRNRAPACMDIAAGEYGYELPYFRGLLKAQAVDVLQADVTRCGGITGFLHVDALSGAECAIVGALSRRCMSLPAVPRCRCATWNTSTITSGLNTCCSTVRRDPVTAPCDPISHAPEMA